VSVAAPAAITIGGQSVAGPVVVVPAGLTSGATAVASVAVAVVDPA